MRDFLEKAIIIGLFGVLTVPLIVTPSLYYPAVTGESIFLLFSYRGTGRTVCAVPLGC